MSLFVIFKFPAVPSPDVAGDRTQKTDAGIRWSILQEGHRGSAGQGKCRRDPESNAAGYSPV
ncbi:unnamed protein product [Staurois parvus]|uniref:Uncharacterized protein n=1 Tax=Staurois parvus TaxID=386267 RepID=A0ABN9E3Y3_9NEOB|nr:unnamed protein product [Staurois parvus]